MPNDVHPSHQLCNLALATVALCILFGGLAWVAGLNTPPKNTHTIDRPNNAK